MIRKFVTWHHGIRVHSQKQSINYTINMIHVQWGFQTAVCVSHYSERGGEYFRGSEYPGIGTKALSLLLFYYYKIVTIKKNINSYKRKHYVPIFFLCKTVTILGRYHIRTAYFKYFLNKFLSCLKTENMTSIYCHI